MTMYMGMDGGHSNWDVRRNGAILGPVPIDE